MVAEAPTLIHCQRLLLDSPAPPPTPPPPKTVVDGTVDSDVLVILAALLCTLICLVGLGFMARCAWHCRFLRRYGEAPAAFDAPTNKGLQKKAIHALPISAFNSTVGKYTECAICLTEFITGETIRVLPECAHCFHPYCIDMWLSSHSSCPSCRHILAEKSQLSLPQPARCRRCGLLPHNFSSTTVPGVSVASSSAIVVSLHSQSASFDCREPDPDRFLP